MALRFSTENLARKSASHPWRVVEVLALHLQCRSLTARDSEALTSHPEIDIFAGSFVAGP